MTTKNNIPVGYKDSAVGVIPQEWEVKLLEDLCENICSGNNKERNKYGKYRIYGSTGIIGYSNTYSYNTPTILIARVGANAGIINKGEGEYDVSDNTLIVCNNKFIYDYEFAYNQLANYNLNKLVFGSGQPLVTAGQLKHIKLAIPPLAEQRKIAEILGVWDEAIEKQSRLIEKLELCKRALMQHLLTGRIRLPGFNTPWQKVKLGEIFKERNETKCEHLPLLSITADRGLILQSESDKKDTSNDDKSKYKRICPNDIGYNTMRMWQGRSALSAMEGIVSPAYTIVTPKVEVDPLFISELIKQPRVVYDFWTHSQGLVGDTLNCKFHDFSQVKVAIPSLPEQKAIAEVLTVADKEIASHRKKLDALRLQKRGLMQQLLTGKTRVKM